MNGAAREAGTSAEIAASRKEAKHADIDSRFVFEPIAVETLGVLNSSARLLLSGAELSSSTSFSFGAAFQRHFAARLSAGR